MSENVSLEQKVDMLIDMVLLLLPPAQRDYYRDRLGKK